MGSASSSYCPVPRGISHTCSLPHPPPWCWQGNCCVSILVQPLLYRPKTLEKNSYPDAGKISYNLINRSNLQSNEKVCFVVFTDAEVSPFEVDKGHGKEILVSETGTEIQLKSVDCEPNKVLEGVCQE